MNHFVRTHNPDAQALAPIEKTAIRIGDRVQIQGTALAKNYPRYLAGSTLTVIGFTRIGTVKCDYDGEKTFHIPMNLLNKILD